MMLNRRDFLILGAGFAAGCNSIPIDTPASAKGERTISAGRTSDYAADGVYAGFRQQGFFIIRKGESLFALSAICTHRKCKLTAEPDRSFYCKCHGSTFDPAGHVTEGPAKRDLPVFPAFTDNDGRFFVKIPG